MSEFGKVAVTSTPAESSFFRALALFKLKTDFIITYIPNLYIPPKNFLGGGLPIHILEKTNVFRKMGVEIWAFDGTSAAHQCKALELCHYKHPMPTSHLQELCLVFCSV